jgi:hypothetical protein
MQGGLETTGSWGSRGSAESKPKSASGDTGYASREPLVKHKGVRGSNVSRGATPGTPNETAGGSGFEVSKFKHWRHCRG